MQLAEGSLHAAEGREAEALLAYEAAATSPRPEIRLEALLCLGDLLLGRGDGDGACRAYFAAREVSESDPRPLVGLAQVALGAGEQREALVLARRALALDPSEVSAACALAVVTASIIPDDAFPYFRAASNLAPDSLFIASQLAAVACARGDHDMALYALERVRGYGDDLGAALHVALGNVLLAAGRRADAKLEARLAMARAPGDPEVVRLWSELQ
jgi:Flp pilus assembly protein TadD